MALRDQPYLPLYIQDFMTDEKLAECSASSTGVYIRIMCLMHKSEEYGKLLLKQKYKQTGEQNKNFASMLVKHLPYDLLTIINALDELTLEGVLKIDGDFLTQKRMVYDNEISFKRASAGKSGGNNTKKKSFASKNAKANIKANAENEIEIEIENKIENEIEIEKFGKYVNLINGKEIVPILCRIWYNKFVSYAKDQEKDFKAVEDILRFMVRQHAIADINTARSQIEATFTQIADFVSKDKFWSNKPLKTIANNIQEFYNKIKNGNDEKQQFRNNLQAELDKRYSNE